MAVQCTNNKTYIGSLADFSAYGQQIQSMGPGTRFLVTPQPVNPGDLREAVVARQPASGQLAWQFTVVAP